MLGAEQLVALILFCFVTSVTPGPNNMMLLASGVNFGFARTIPHMLGIAIGFTAMIVLVGLGIGRLFELLPWLHGFMKVAGVAYMVWLAWKIANAGAIGEAREGARPMTFLQAAAFQWVNPKAWAMALSAIAAYTLAESQFTSLFVVAGTFGLVNLPTITIWAMFGVWLRRYLSEARNVRRFNWTMAVLLVASLVPVLFEG
ncbi:MAG: LysE family translocator [Alphaproteobacteria bacterium]|nr:LysE family translocator [Alphaproteobacteria bacterium]